MTTRVIQYGRVSTDQQAEEGISLAMQREKMQGYCVVYDLEVVAELSDPGESAKDMNRPALLKALQMLRDGEADGIVCYSLSRLTRNVGDMQALLAEFFGDRPRHRRSLFSVTEHIDTTSAMGRMCLNILLAVYQGEREMVGEKTRDSLQCKIQRGERCGAVRYGYVVGDDGKTLVPVESEQRAIELMRTLRSQGLTFRAIAGELAGRNIPPKQASTWSHAAVRQILNRKVA